MDSIDSCNTIENFTYGINTCDHSGNKHLSQIEILNYDNNIFTTIYKNGKIQAYNNNKFGLAADDFGFGNIS